MKAESTIKNENMRGKEREREREREENVNFRTYGERFNTEHRGEKMKSLQ